MNIAHVTMTLAATAMLYGCDAETERGAPPSKDVGSTTESWIQSIPSEDESRDAFLSLFGHAIPASSDYVSGRYDYSSSDEHSYEREGIFSMSARDAEILIGKFHQSIAGSPYLKTTASVRFDRNSVVVHNDEEIYEIDYNQETRELRFYRESSD